MKSYNLALAVVLALGMMFATSCKDACEKDDPCINGTCADVDGEASCTCDAGYEGDNCDTEMRDKFEGTYTFTDACYPGVNNTTVASESSTEVTQLLMTNMLGDASGGTAVATISGSTIMIASQDIVDNDNDTWTISSNTATLANGGFSLTCTFVQGTAVNETCVLTFVKQ